MSERKNTVIRADNIEKSFVDGDERLCVLSGLSINLQAGERVAITGPSGTGKTTLLYLLGGLDRPDSGTIYVSGRNISEMSESACATWRNLNLAYVFQQHHLLREFSALENVALPLLIRGVAKSTATDRARHFMESVGMSHRLNHLPEQLSGGQAQRVAIAQALVSNPQCILMDEPTGNLDAENAKRIGVLLSDLSEEHQLSVVLATHNTELADATHRQLCLRDGALVPM